MMDGRMSGYRRPDGRFGIRNHVLILPCSLCASETARFAAENVKGAVYLANQGGCSLSRRDLKVTLEVLAGIAANPNIYGRFWWEMAVRWCRRHCWRMKYGKKPINLWRQ